MNIKEQFERDGYLLLREQIPTSVTKNALDFLLTYTAQYEGDATMLPQGAVRMTNEVFDAIKPLAIALKDTGVLNRLVGDAVYMRLPPSARRVPPLSQRDVIPAHQDIAYNKKLPWFLTAWMPLVEIDSSSGGIALYPSLGHKHELPIRDAPGWGPYMIDIHDAKPLTFRMSPGDVLFFHRYMTHSAVPNTSETVRFSADMRFYGKDPSSADRWFDMQTLQGCRSA